MEFARFSWRRLGASIAIGFVIEAALVYLEFSGVWNRSPLWLWGLFRATQEPGTVLIVLLVDTIRPGFEEQMGYIYLIPLVQWVVYCVIIYLLSLWFSGRRRETAAGTAHTS